MKVRAAVLNAMGAVEPYATSKPLAIEELELRDCRGPARSSCASGPRACAIPTFR